MTRAGQACPKPGCPHLKPCPDHPKIDWIGSRRSRQLPRRWRRIRAFVLSRDPFCQDGDVCGGTGMSTEVDHVGDPHDHSITNLRGICHACHARRSGKQGRAARA